MDCDGQQTSANSSSAPPAHGLRSVDPFDLRSTDTSGAGLFGCESAARLSIQRRTRYDLVFCIPTVFADAHSTAFLYNFPNDHDVLHTRNAASVFNGRVRTQNFCNAMEIITHVIISGIFMNKFKY